MTLKVVEHAGRQRFPARFCLSEIGAAPSRVQLGDAANHNAIEVTSWLSMSLHEFRPPSLEEEAPHDQPAI
jgi:hypothetical protein